MSSTDSDNHVPVLSDFLSNVPPVLTFALVQLAPCISVCRTGLQIASWRTSWYQSWLVLGSWWALCLLLNITLRLFLPFLIVVYIAWSQRRPKKQSLPEPTNEAVLRHVITDLTIIQSYLPKLSVPAIEIPKLFRVALIFSGPYVLISYFVSVRVICGLAGTVFLTWRAPWAMVLRAAVWRSAWFRWGIYRSWSFLIGEPIPVKVLSFQPTANSSTPVQSLRFLFTIYENQRWWMALDWTAALLPGERPSWCSASQHPLLPPNAFTLPENTTVYIRDETGARVKRTATWKWEEPEWKVLVRKEGQGGVSRVERPLPNVDPSGNATGSSGSKLLKAAGRIRDASTGGSNAGSSADGKNTSGSSETVDPDVDDSQDADGEDDNILTDVDGWVYGDNKWENQSNRGGISKYTRYRRWTRVAVVFEVVEPVTPGKLGIKKQDSEEVNTFTAEASIAPTDTIPMNPPDSPLRQRLRNALKQ